eukprot:COSAG05_NODE_137_length_16843_cov_121.090779_22_plen_220_part_00
MGVLFEYVGPRPADRSSALLMSSGEITYLSKRVAMTIVKLVIPATVRPTVRSGVSVLFCWMECDCPTSPPRRLPLRLLLLRRRSLAGQFCFVLVFGCTLPMTPLFIAMLHSSVIFEYAANVYYSIPLPRSHHQSLINLVCERSCEGIGVSCRCLQDWHQRCTKVRSGEMSARSILCTVGRNPSQLLGILLDIESFRGALRLSLHFQPDFSWMRAAGLTW